MKNSILVSLIFIFTLSNSFSQDVFKLLDLPKGYPIWKQAKNNDNSYAQCDPSYYKLTPYTDINDNCDHSPLGGEAITSTSDLGLYSRNEACYIRLVTNDAPIRFYSDDGKGTNVNMTIEANGSVGIGTIDLNGYKFVVKGKAHFCKVIAQYQGWCDYVFEPEYNLMPISELNNYIKQNKHLPEIPTTQQVEENDIDLGEMNKLLLKKVEELTLYLIKQQEQLDEQAEEINKLKK